jgi:hypothetical protein
MIQSAEGSQPVPYQPPANYKRPCWSKRHCTGKVLGKFTHAHNCWNAGGKSWGGSSGGGGSSPSGCQNKTR